MIAIIDYGAGNLFSVANALNFLGLESDITNDPKRLELASGLILPGVGAFPDAMGMLSSSGLLPSIREQILKKPLLGICLGMQLLFEEGFEFRSTKGLGFLPGKVDRIVTAEKIPHMGWNSLHITQKSPLLEGVSEGESVYFVHSYKAYTEEWVITSSCMYGTDIPATVEKGYLFGAQFHPEKSGETGLTMLKNFARLTK